MSSKSRRSWFDTPPLTTLHPVTNCTQEQKAERPKAKRRSLDSVENLTLTHFTAPPRIGFGNVILGRSKVRTLLIRNPHEYEQEVIVERFPDKKKFSVDTKSFTVSPNEVYSLEITWTPEEAGGVREMVQFYINNVYRLQAFLFGTVEKPNPARKVRRPGIGPRLRQQQQQPSNVLQTPALASIQSNYSPRRSEEARERIYEADQLDGNKENSENLPYIQNDKRKVLPSINAILGQCDNVSYTSSVYDQRRGEDINLKSATCDSTAVLSTPTPLESTKIERPVEREAVPAPSSQRTRKQWKGISDGAAMSPIPLSEDNEHGIIVDSYYQPSNTPLHHCRKGHASDAPAKTGEMGETFAKPQLPLGYENAAKQSTESKRPVSHLPSSAFTSSVGQLLHPDLNSSKADETSRMEKTSLPVDATYGVEAMRHPKALPASDVLLQHGASTFIAAALSPQTPRSGGKLTQASPNTMLNESLSLISNMKVLDTSNISFCPEENEESRSSSPTDNNVSLSCSIISTGLGMISPDSFMEDMRNSSFSRQHVVPCMDEMETNNTSTPNQPDGTPSRPRQVSRPQSVHCSLNVPSGTPGKHKRQISKVGPPRRSITSQYQRNEAKVVAAAAQAVKQERENLAAPNSGQSRKRPFVKQDIRCKATGKSVASNKTSPTTRSPSKRLIKQSALRRARTRSAKKNVKSPQTENSCLSLQMNTENCMTPDSKIVTREESLTVVKSKSFDSGTVTKTKQEKSPSKIQYFPDIHAEDNAGWSIENASHSSQSQLFPDLKKEVDCLQESEEPLVKAQIETKLGRYLTNSTTDVDITSNAVCNTLVERAVDAADRCLSQTSPTSSPRKFLSMSPSKLPSSPSGLDFGRRGTMTVTKSRPSDALMAALINRKKLFGEPCTNSLAEVGAPQVVDGDSEMQENMEVFVEEKFEERDGKMYVVVKETTNVTKSVTDTYVEQISSLETGCNSPGHCFTPTRLPNSPDPLFSRRSTHVLRSPKVIDKQGMKTRKLQFDGNHPDKSCKFETVQETPNACVNQTLQKTKSDTFEKDSSTLLEKANSTSKSLTLSSTCAKSDTFEKDTSTILENSAHNTSTIKSDTFEKEATTLLEPLGENESIGLSYTMIRDKPRQVPITSVCAMSPRLVDYDDGVSEEGGSVSADNTKDSLDIKSTQSEDSLNKSKSFIEATEEKPNKNAENDIDKQVVQTDSNNVEQVEKSIICKVNSQESHATVLQEVDTFLQESESKPRDVSESEDEFYDTQSQRYYDALSDTINEDLNEDLLDVVSSENGASVKTNEKVLDTKANAVPCRTDKRKGLEAEIDRKEVFEIDQRPFIAKTGPVVDHQVLQASVPILLHEDDKSCTNPTTQERKTKLRRSLSADQVMHPVAFSVDMTDAEPSGRSTRQTKRDISQDNASCKVSSKVQAHPLKTEVFARPTHQPKVASRGRTAATSEACQRSRSLSNLEKKRNHLPDAKSADVRTTDKHTVTGAMTKTKKLQRGVAQSRLILVKKPKTGAARHPMPFAARNMYYDERWMEKQERGFVQWLNFVLTPPDEYVAATTKPKVSAGSLSLDTQHHVTPQLAPTREVLSFRAYAARRRLNQLRRQACQLYQSEPVVSVICKVETEVERRRIAMRKDKMVHADLGIKQKLLDLLLQYSSLWLRVGLETVFGEMLMLQSNQDVVGLSRFIVTRLLTSPDIAAEFAHPTVPHLYKEGYAAAISRHTVKKFLLLVYFLDFAKASRLIDHDPCLFCKDADIKSSKEILVEFSKEVLSGEGDINRHLAYLGYTVSHTQCPIDEFDFAVKTLSQDLRDGVRLCRVLQQLTGEKDVMGRLRTPAISRLQKVHNTEEVFKMAQHNGLDLSTSGANARDIVDGHREKTLALLWALILFSQNNIQVNEDQLREEIALLTKSLKLKVAMQRIGAISIEDFKASRDSGAGDIKLLTDNSRLQLIFQWCRLVCLHYGVKVENFTVSFSDGRALCCLLHHYHPALLPLSMVNLRTSVSLQEEVVDREEQQAANREDADTSMDWGLTGENDPDLFATLLANEKSNFKVMFEKVSALGGVPLMLRSADMSNTIPDERVVSTYVAYLCSRLLDVREEVRAARILQQAWRRRLLRHAVRERQKKTAAATTLQRWIRPHLTRRLEEKRRCAAVLIQSAVRVWLARSLVARLRQRQAEDKLRERQEVTALVLQRMWRGKCGRREAARVREEKAAVRAALMIQKTWRGHMGRREYMKVKEEVENMRAAVMIQRLWRGRQGRMVAQRLAEVREAERIEKLRSEAANVIQKVWRGKEARKEVMKLKEERERDKIAKARDSAALVFQKHWRRNLAVQEVQMLREEIRRFKAAVFLQKVCRGWMVRKDMLDKQAAAVRLQVAWRGVIAKRILTQLSLDRDNRAASTINNAIRGYLCKKRLRKLKQASIVFQKCWRRVEAGRKVTALKAERDQRLAKEEEVRRHKAAVVIQARVKGVLVRRDFVKQQEASVLIQAHWRKFIAVRQANQLRYELGTKASITIVKWIKGYVARKTYLNHKRAAVTVQCFWRVVRAKNELVKLKQAQAETSAMLIQKTVRGFFQRQRFMKLKFAAITIQCAWRKKKAGEELAALKEKRRVRASVVLQSNFKAYLARQKFLDVKNSAVTIQKYWRKLLAQRMVVEMRLQMRLEATIVLQKYFRGTQERSRFLTLKHAVLVIQKNWRKLQAIRSLEEKRKEQQTKSALAIQRTWRGWAVRKQMLIEIKAAIQIQSFWRMTLAQNQFVKKKTATTIIQCWHRANLAGKQQRAVYLKQRQTAVCIQSAWRGYKQREEFVKQKRAAVVIQASFRCFRRRLKFLALRLACVIIQRRYKACVEGRRQRAAYLQQLSAAVCIQHWYRQYIEYRFMRQTAAALMLQTNWRKICAERSFRAQRIATVIIQRRFRECRLAKICRVEYQNQRNAAKTIQRAFRGYKAKKDHAKFLTSIVKLQACVKAYQVRKAFKRKQIAVLTIQEKYRAYRLGKVFRNAFILIKTSATKIQRFYRAVQARRNVQEEMFKQKVSTTLIQASYRGWRDRHDFVHRRQAVIYLQQRYRALRAGRQARMEWSRVRKAVLLLQSWWRGCLKMRKAKHELMLLRNEAEMQRLERLRIEEEWRAKMERWAQERSEDLAARVLQRSWRGYLVMRDYVTRENAAVVIQTWARGYLARLRYARTVAPVVLLQQAIKGWVYRRRFETARLAATIIQARWRETLNARKLRADYLQLRKTCVMLQSLVRMKSKRQKFVGFVKCVICVQSHVRMMLQRQKYLDKREKTVFLQRKVQAHLAMSRCKDEFHNIKRSVITIQATVRMWLAQRHTERIQAAIMLQKQWRMCQQRSAFLREYEAAQVIKSFMLMKQKQQLEIKVCNRAACTIQQAFRSFLAQREMQRYDAVCVIQQAFRAFRLRKAAKRLRSACILQRAFRTYILKKEYQRLKAAIVIQHAYRSWLKKRDVKRNVAAQTIQRWFKVLQVKQQQRQSAAASVITRTIRRVIVHKRGVRHKSATLLQSVARMFIDRKRYLMLRQSAVVLQAALRGCRAREVAASLRRRHRAAVVIQAAVRGFMVRRIVAPALQDRLRAAQKERVLHRASTKIQALWRGYLVRRDSKSKKLAQARQRLAEANRSFDETRSLGSRTTSALDYLLRERDLAFILESLMHLDAATRLSPVCCERMVEVNAVTVLYRLINSCNRSLPHMDLIKYCISILLNLAKYEKTRSAVAEPADCVSTILELMQIYRDKGAIFLHSCMLLGILGLQPVLKETIMTHQGIKERLQGIHSLVLRKQRATHTRQTALAKMAASRSTGALQNCTLPVLATPSKCKPGHKNLQRKTKVRPAWSLARDAFKEFEDPLTAINFVMNVLGIMPKTK